MAKNTFIKARTIADIDERVERVLKGLGNPEPPLDLRLVRELLKLDFGYYSSNDPGLLQETVSRLRIAGKQILLRPTLLIDAVRKRDIKALFIPDQRRILLDESVPKLKHRWNEAHEVGHSILPWHDGAMLGDNDHTLMPSCHEELECEANFTAGRLLFMQQRFVKEALDMPLDMNSVKALSKTFGNTNTSTFWRCVEEVWGQDKPVVGLITGHPHPSRRKPEFDPADPCKHFIQSPAFAAQFSDIRETDVFNQIVAYCTSNKGGPLGGGDVILIDDNGDEQIFEFESFSFFHNILTLGLHKRSKSRLVAAAE